MKSRNIRLLKSNYNIIVKTENKDLIDIGKNALLLYFQIGELFFVDNNIILAALLCIVSVVLNS